MMLRFFPWNFLMARAARRYGVLDPAMLMARLRGFAQPSEVAEPMELLRAGIVFHARGLLNSKAIQQNLDWVWPFWVEKQFNPEDPSFIPRAFSFSHVNLTHRNWTAVGVPDLPIYPIVDPRGLLTPLYDGWSIDFWVVTDSGKRLLPSKLGASAVMQDLKLDPTLTVATHCASHGLSLATSTSLVEEGADEGWATATEVVAVADEAAWLAVVVRPYNPEGIQMIHKITMKDDGVMHVNGESDLRFSKTPERVRMAHYAEGDVYHDLSGDSEQRSIKCDVGMATAAALFRMEPGSRFEVRVTASVTSELPRAARRRRSRGWDEAAKACAKFEVCDPKMSFLYNAAVRTLLLLSAEDIVPGPYTYRRFWFRDACLMLHPLMLIGGMERAARIIDGFPARQTKKGYYLSQEGEWDSNGQVLWIVARHAKLAEKPVEKKILLSLEAGVKWLGRKRLRGAGVAGTEGLLPAGFSAEHLGPNDFYYWDDFWAWAGLRDVAELFRRHGMEAAATEAVELAEAFESSLRKSIEGIPASRSKGGIPAAPGRRMDAGAIGCMVADYPLQLFPPDDSRVRSTLEFLMRRCFTQGGFYQEMIHSGINAYLTLDLAQSLLRMGDPRFAELIRRVAELATPTGQWPEAIHPHTLGGCMGDGQHGWAAGEWIMMIRNCFVREEGDSLILGSGILPEWIEGGSATAFGPTLTPWGEVSVEVAEGRLSVKASFESGRPASLQVRVPGYLVVEARAGENQFELTRS